MTVAPAQSLILLEDVDAAFVSREDTQRMATAYDGLNPVTFSGFLNMLDGVASSEGRILFMTTNYLDRLDPALIRPGRVDFKAYIGHVTDEQLTRAFLKFYPESDDLVSQFVSAVRQKAQNTGLAPVSMAMVQGFFLLYKNQPEEAILNVAELWKK
jgi:chaperone BCS1